MGASNRDAHLLMCAPIQDLQSFVVPRQHGPGKGRESHENVVKGDAKTHQGSCLT